MNYLISMTKEEIVMARKSTLNKPPFIISELQVDAISRIKRQILDHGGTVETIKLLKLFPSIKPYTPKLGDK